MDTGEGLFGTFLFFVYGDRGDPSSSYSMTAASKYVHFIEVDPDALVKASSLWYDDNYKAAQPVVDEVMARFGVDEETASDLLDESKNVFDYDGDGDDSWWVQHATARAARLMGYQGVEVTDEQGSAVMVDMAGWEHQADAELS